MSSQPNFNNFLLRSLSPEDLALLRPSLSLQRLEADGVLERCGARVTQACFIESGIVAVVAQSERWEAEVNMIGPEGMTGMSLLLDQPRAAYRCHVRVSGQAWCIPGRALVSAVSASRTLRAHLLSHVHAMMVETALTALSNACGTIELRLARWLLMVQDRDAEQAIAITHDGLATALGVRRASVTAALHLLEGKRLLKSTRGMIMILERTGLAAMCSGMYRAVAFPSGVEAGRAPGLVEPDQGRRQTSRS